MKNNCKQKEIDELIESVERLNGEINEKAAKSVINHAGYYLSLIKIKMGSHPAN